MILNDVTAVLIAALVGALAGVVGAGFASLASIRANQLAARVPLGAKIHSLATSVVMLASAVGKPEYDDRMRAFQQSWNDFVVHQKILCPSDRLTDLGILVRDAATDPAVTAPQFVLLSGEAMNAATEIIAAYSEHTFRWRARRAERGPVERFARGSVAQLKSPGVVRQLRLLE